MQDVLPIRRSIDILSEVLKDRRKEQKIVGFSAEFQLNEETMKMKWEKKPVDLLVGTQVDNGLMGNKRIGFAQLSAKYNFFQEGRVVFSGVLDKKNLASEIFSRIGI